MLKVQKNFVKVLKGFLTSFDLYLIFKLTERVRLMRIQIFYINASFQLFRHAAVGVSRMEGSVAVSLYLSRIQQEIIAEGGTQTSPSVR